jgi:hypothetical protein
MVARTVAGGGATAAQPVKMEGSATMRNHSATAAQLPATISATTGRNHAEGFLRNPGRR